MKAEVAVHRWFSDGAGWAYFPTLESQMPGVIRTVSHLINDVSSTSGTKDIQMRFGNQFLVGVLEPDNACLDQKARHPWILRVAVLPFTPHDSSLPKIQSALGGFLPLRSGPDRSLEIDAPDDVSSISARLLIAELPSGASPSDPLESVGVGVRGDNLKTRQRKRTRFVLTTIALLVLCAGVYLFVRIGSDRRAPSPVPQEPQTDGYRNPELAALIHTQLQRWRSDRASDTDGTLVNYFFEILSWRGIGDPKPSDGEVLDPYTAFAVRLPDQPDTSKAWTDEKVNASLLKLGRSLRDAAVPPARSADLVKQIADCRSYDLWLKKQTQRPGIRGHHPDLPHVAAYVVRFRTPEAGVVQAANAMANCLRRWGFESLDQNLGPYLECKLFFETLTYPTLKIESQEWVKNNQADVTCKLAFISGLPNKADSDGWMFDNEQNLYEDLLRLDNAIESGGGDGHPRLPNCLALVNSITRRMDYDEFRRNWSRRTQVPQELNGANPAAIGLPRDSAPDDVDSFVAHFESHR